ncbi:uncharacterized protein LAESUDRAFT_725188 [Laetiporus sulphureus 93-53]|uniref:F-box domain-containing protein n=1 Tax=Laetiporus sulphureus 93-53 TaxID=1314785 RepID=A0A165EL24_9APHY|nr:uncharacterized protein LAESUDRAFT_725188 [Laetiporus sulphureus 93-53]KZT07280.1 hypothetical protein LAESUDRAFT_725188 [Laetiporus sulphureus 93-53]
MAVRNSTSPARRIGNRHLPPIPIDVYMLIVDELCDDAGEVPVPERKAILFNLSLVCRLFAALSTPKLFDLVAFVGNADMKAERMLQNPRTKWFTQLSRGDETACLLGTFVKRLEVFNWLPLRIGDPSSPCPDLLRHIEIIPRFPNLTNLSLVRTPITLDLFRAATNLHKLESLSIRSCAFSKAGPGTRSPSRSLARLTSVEVTAVEAVGPYISALASLAKSPALRSLKTTEWRLARAVMESGVVSALQCLEIPFEPREACMLFAFLNRTPTIIDLSIIGVMEEDPLGGGEALDAPMLSLARTALPKLQELRCPPYLLDTFLKKQPLWRLSLLDFRDWLIPSLCANQSLLQSLARFHLRELEVPAWLVHAYPKLLEYTPKLTKLSICYPMHTLDTPLEVVVHSLCSLAGSRLLTHIDLRFLHAVWQLNLPLQHQMVTKHLARAFPSVTTFSFVDAVGWCKRTGDTAWKPVIRGRESVKALLELQEPGVWDILEVDDYGGALAGLFPSGIIPIAVSQRLQRSRSRNAGTGRSR